MNPMYDKKKANQEQKELRGYEGTNFIRGQKDERTRKQRRS